MASPSLNATLDELFPPHTRVDLARLYQAMDRMVSVPRLETVLGIATRADTHGLSGLRVLREMWTAQPNAAHRHLAAFADAGARNVTMNFDTCIERVETPSGNRRLSHLHGTIDDLSTVREGASVVAIERGFPEPQVAELTQLLDDAALLVFVGYSGSDFFDVDPFLQHWAAAGHAAGKTVPWIDHDHDLTDLRQISSTRTQLQLLLAGRAAVHELRGPTLAVLEDLASEWNVSPSAAPPSPGSPPPQMFDSPVDEGRRRRAQTLLYRHLGATALLRHAITEDCDLHALAREEIEADIAWSEGRYRDARRHWRRAWPETDAATVLRRRERDAATHWVQGRLGYAAFLLVRGMKIAERNHIDPTPLAETLGHVVVHMRRCPEWRWYPIDRLERRARQYLPADAHGLGVHDDARYAALRADLARGGVATSVTEHASAVTSMREYESLNGLINFEHGRLRRQATAGEPASVGDYRRLERWALALGRTESATKVKFLPGAERAFSSWSVAVAAASRMQITPWQRVRWGLPALLRHVRRRRRQGVGATS